MKRKSTTEHQADLMLISERLKHLRKAKGYNSYEHIAFELRMSRSAYWRLESGKNFQLVTLIRICELLQISLTEFFQGLELPTRPSTSTDKN